MDNVTKLQGQNGLPDGRKYDIKSRDTLLQVQTSLQTKNMAKNDSKI